MQRQTPAARFDPLVPRSPPDYGPAPDHRQVGAVDMPQLSVAAVARKLGVAPATLRTWDRRYGIGPTDHTPGRHGFRTFIAGPGWADVTPGPQIVRLGSLQEATDVISALTSMPPPPQPDL